MYSDIGRREADGRIDCWGIELKSEFISETDVAVGSIKLISGAMRVPILLFVGRDTEIVDYKKKLQPRS